MHLGLITVAIPDPFTGGGGNWMTCYLDRLAGRYKLTMIAVVGKHDFDPERGEALTRGWAERGVEVRTVTYERLEVSRGRRLRGMLGLDDTALIPDLATAAKVAPIVAEVKPDIVVAQSCVAASYASAVKGVPKLAIQAEGYHINLQTELDFNPPPDASAVYRMKQRRLIDATDRAERRMLAGFDRLAYMGQHYVQRAHAHGLKQAVFLSTPVPEPAKIRALPFVRDASRPFTALLIGHLRSTSNRTQLPLLVDEVLPAMGRHFAGIDWRMRIVGRYDSIEARYLKPLRDHPNVELAGPVFPPDDDFLNCDALFVPVPARTGSRVRIIQGFAFGCPVVAHEANTLGIAELAHGGNLLLGSTGDDLAAQLRRLHDDPALGDRLGQAGRAVYEACYQPDYAAALLEHLLAETWSAYHGRPIREWA
ncbi:glycosyltransferase [Phycisphaeraceae bacterium D3-23]